MASFSSYQNLLQEVDFATPRSREVAELRFKFYVPYMNDEQISANGGKFKTFQGFLDKVEDDLVFRQSFLGLMGHNFAQDSKKRLHHVACHECGSHDIDSFHYDFHNSTNGEFIGIAFPYCCEAHAHSASRAVRECHHRISKPAFLAGDGAHMAMRRALPRKSSFRVHGRRPATKLKNE